MLVYVSRHVLECVCYSPCDREMHTYVRELAVVYNRSLMEN